MQIIERLGWMLFHSLWQILLIALAYAVVVSALRLRSPHARYALGCAALCLMVLVPAATFFGVNPLADAVVTSSPPRESSPLRSQADKPPANAHKRTFEVSGHKVNESSSEWLEDETLPLEAVGQAGIGPTANPPHSWRKAVRSVLPMAVVLWWIGILIFSLRPLLGLSHVIRLRRHGLLPVSMELIGLVEKISRRLGIRRPVEVAQSPGITVPVVIGVLRPLLILSPNALACLSPRQLEGVLAHELAHIRRYDFFINLLQTLIEMILFYHPAMWWVSRRIRDERENCCDDLAIGLTGDRLSYAEMLLLLEKSCQVPRLASAASGGSLLKRVRRIAVPDDAPSGKQSSAFLGGMMMVMLSCLLAIWLAAANGILTAADTFPDNPEKPALATPGGNEEDHTAGLGENENPRTFQVAQEQSYDEQGFAPLHRAAMSGDVEEVASLIEDGADVNVPQVKFQGTPLQYAAAGGKKAAVELLLASGASIDSIDSAGRTPLMWAAQQGQTEVVEVLLKNKADVKAETSTGWTAFRYAVQSGKTELVKLFKEKVSFDQLDKEGFAELHRAASGGHAKTVQVLVDAGADVNVRQKTYQGSPMQYAANQGHAEVVKILLKAKATIDATDSFGRTPLMWAAMSGKKEVVNVLLSSDANINAKTESGWTALRYARDKGHKEIADLLIKHGATEETPTPPRSPTDESKE